jgi:hypothetical protein
MSSETAPGAKPRAGWVNALIGVVIGLALGMTIGTAGAVKLWYDANYLLETTQAQHMTALAAKDAERAEVQAQYDTLQKKAAGMNARIAVSRAVDQLDQRNFGTAQAEIERARELLGQSLPAVSSAHCSSVSATAWMWPTPVSSGLLREDAPAIRRARDFIDLAKNTVNAQ